MQPISWFYLLVALAWWLFFFRKLVEWSHSPLFLAGPVPIQWFLLYLDGWIFFLSEYGLERQLQLIFFPATVIPIVMLIRISLFLLLAVGYAVGIGRLIDAPRSRRFIGLLLALYGLAILLILHLAQTGTSYLQLYWTTNALLGGLAIVAVVMFAGFSRQVSAEFPEDNLVAHHLWEVVFTLLAGVGLLIRLGLGGYGLLFGYENIYNPFELLAQLLGTLAMVALVMLITSQHFQMILYPLKYTLFRQVQRIERVVLPWDVRKTQPARRINLLRSFDLELALYQSVIAILDHYPYLANHEVLKQKIQQIEAEATSFERLVDQLAALYELV